MRQRMRFKIKNFKTHRGSRFQPSDPKNLPPIFWYLKSNVNQILCVSFSIRFDFTQTLSSALFSSSHIEKTQTHESTIFFKY